MPEGDSLRRTATRLRVLEGQTLAVAAPHPRAAALGIAPRLNGKRLERVRAVGKNLLLEFEGGLVLRSHLRMRGRWQVGRSGAARVGTPWLVLRSSTHEALLWNGPVLELGTAGLARLGPDVMADPPDLAAMLDRLRRTDRARAVGEALLDQRLVAGIGNMWRAEVLFATRISPWARLGELDDRTLLRVLSTAGDAMRAPRGRRSVYRRAGLPCRVCGARVAVARQGDDARAVYWCPACQAGRAPGSA